MPRRPLPGLGLDQPGSDELRTMLDTVAGASPVARAISAWVNAPPSAVGGAHPEHVEDPPLVGGPQGCGRPGAATTRCGHMAEL